MSIRKDLQTLVYLQEKEQEAKTIQEQQQQELEQLKKDIINLIDIELFDILEDEEQKKDLLYYYFDNKYNLIDNIYLELINKTIKKRKAKSGKVDDAGLVNYEYETIKKYQDYNAEHLKEYIEQLLYDYIKKIVKEQKEQEKAAKERKNNDIFNYIMQLYRMAGLDVFRFYDTLTTDKIRAMIFDELRLDYTSDNIKLYSKAIKEFKTCFCIGARKKEQKKKGGGFLLYGVAVALGIFEGLTKDKKRR